ncbi:AAA family ATPase [Ruficoccus sp. ZRK36]|uniref:ATP-dependent nuclease n=1 Tax=Ruficoccus sp. ZRK36 TaxID=2866311 RepID=UPI001C737833|nr:AAA family ATPase [Ruficoccus sp. ZRK36]QYY37129.1 ATP-binding protein [Ruficoccus sp. ZRK36]
MKIKSINIKNFRSIQSASLTLSNLNVFVGKNDSGKSNLLRALNLFFNDGNGYELDWDRDFCSFAQVAKRKAPEIQMTLVIEPSAGFNDRKRVKWDKYWRRGGLHYQDVKYIDNKALSGKSKIPALIHSARLDYVPATKGDDYFSELLASIHDMLEKTVEVDIRKAAENFTKAINSHTTPIVADIFEKLSMTSSIGLPSNLRDLFSRLQFSSEDNGQRFSLEQRGDGIKARHIPIILRWLAKQAETLSAPGRPKVVSLWAYEEPENNLEMSSCLELANEMLADSRHIQTFVTTHAPAYYSVATGAAQGDVSIFGVTKDSSSGKTSIEQLDRTELQDIDQSMGLMPLVEPYLSNALDRIHELEQIKVQLSSYDKPTVFVEGPSDKALLEIAIKLFFSWAKDQLRIECSQENGGGHTWVSERIIAWGHMRSKYKAIGLFDRDADAIESRKEATGVLKHRNGHNTSYVHIEPNDYLKPILAKKINVPYSVDELFREVDWDHAEQQGWLVERSDKIALLYNYGDPNQSFNEFLEEKLPCPKARRIVTKKIHKHKKEAFCKYLCALPEGQSKEAFEGLKATVDKVLDKLGINIYGF